MRSHVRGVFSRFDNRNSTTFRHRSRYRSNIVSVSTSSAHQSLNTSMSTTLSFRHSIRGFDIVSTSSRHHFDVDLEAPVSPPRAARALRLTLLPGYISGRGRRTSGVRTTSRERQYSSTPLAAMLVRGWCGAGAGWVGLGPAGIKGWARALGEALRLRRPARSPPPPVCRAVFGGCWASWAALPARGRWLRLRRRLRRRLLLRFAARRWPSG